jgi:hypothetical protein
MKNKSQVLINISVILFLLFIAGVVIFFVQILKEKERIENVRLLAQPPIIIPDVEEVIIHDSRNITVYSLNQTTRKLEPNSFCGAYEIFRDVVPGEKAYAKKLHKLVDGRLSEWMEIHLNPSIQINGSKWNHGKLGRGQTSVIR